MFDVFVGVVLGVLVLSHFVLHWNFSQLKAAILNANKKP